MKFVDISKVDYMPKMTLGTALKISALIKQLLSCAITKTSESPEAATTATQFEFENEGLFGYPTGVRVGEIVHYDPEDVDFNPYQSPK